MFSQNIKLGQILLDTDGKRVQAHGGSLFFDNDTFYFYGENKEKLMVRERYGLGEYVITLQKIYIIGEMNGLLSR